MVQDYREEWLLNFGKRMGMPELEFDNDGICQLFFDEDLLLTIYKPDDNDKLVIFGQLPVTPPLSSGVMKEMLKKNRSSAKFLEPVISLSPEEDSIEVHIVLDQTNIEQGGDEGIEKVIEDLEYWKKTAAHDLQEEDKGDKKDGFVPGIDFA